MFNDRPSNRLDSTTERQTVGFNDRTSNGWIQRQNVKRLDSTIERQTGGLNGRTSNVLPFREVCNFSYLFKPYIN